MYSSLRITLSKFFSITTKSSTQDELMILEDKYWGFVFSPIKNLPVSKFTWKGEKAQTQRRDHHLVRALKHVLRFRKTPRAFTRVAVNG